MTQNRHSTARKRVDWSIYDRAGTWYVRFRRDGRMQRESLKTGDKALAKERAELLVSAHNRGKLQEAKEAIGLSKRAALTIGRVLELYRQEVAATSLKERTTRNYELALLSVLRKAHPEEKPEDLTLEHVNRALATRYAAAMLAGLSKDGRGRETRDRGIASTLNQAAAIFGRNVRHIYGELPAGVYAFLDYKHRTIPVDYVAPDELLVERTHQKAQELEQTDPALYVCYLLGFRLAMRPGERERASWADITTGKDGQALLTATSKRKTRRIPVAPDLLATLRRLTQDEVLIMPGGNRTTKRLSGWMRSIGWTRDKFTKSTYELRKLAASAIATDHDPLTAAKILGNTVPVLMKHYADRDLPISAQAMDASLLRRTGTHHAQ